MAKKNKRNSFHCSSEKQKRAIKASYARKAAQNKTVDSVKIPPSVVQSVCDNNALLSKKFPFWARFTISKNRTTLVIDEAPAYDTKKKKTVDGFVHREATHTKGHGEPIVPNPDKNDPDPMYLRSPRVHPKYLFVPHDKNLDMPEDLRQRYDGNNHKQEIPAVNDEDKKT